MFETFMNTLKNLIKKDPILQIFLRVLRQLQKIWFFLNENPNDDLPDDGGFTIPKKPNPLPGPSPRFPSNISTLNHPKKEFQQKKVKPPLLKSNPKGVGVKAPPLRWNPKTYKWF